MSRLPKVVPWKSEKDILELKDLFYEWNNDSNHSGGEEDSRVRALAKVKAYQTRGASLPHSIESTALLTAAILNDTPSNDPFASRMAYSMAIIRFVNGLLDPSQRSQYAIPLHLLAKSVDLPSAFVELRHIATHESLPSLENLRQMTKRALTWLWHHYWSRNSYEDNQRQQEAIAESDSKKEKIKELLREWRRIRRSDPSKVMKPGDGSPEGIQFWRLVKKLQTQVESDDEVFVEILLTRNILVPSGNDGFKKLSSSIKLFGPLFEHLNEDGFVQRFIIYLIQLLNAQKTSLDWDQKKKMEQELELEQESQREPHFFNCIKKWVMVLLIPSGSKKKTGYLISGIEDILKELLALPREWNVEILQHYLNNSSSSTTTLDFESLKTLVEQMASQIESFNSITLAPHEAPVNSEEQRKRIRESDNHVGEFIKRVRLEKEKVEPRSSDEKVSSSTQWKTVENWTPRPIGVL